MMTQGRHGMQGSNQGVWMVERTEGQWGGVSWLIHIKTSNGQIVLSRDVLDRKKRVALWYLW